MYDIEIYIAPNGKSEIKEYINNLNIKNEIWELRPLRDRILFASWSNNKFILLSVFMKQTQKNTKKRN